MSDIENLIVRRAAAMAEKDGVGVQVVHVFGATSQLSAALAEARDRLINHPGQIADTLSGLLDADEAAATGVSDELRRLVIAARIVAYEDQSPEALEELDKASEAFAELVPWEDEPQEPVADADPDAGTDGEGETTDAAPAPEAAPAEADTDAAGDETASTEPAAGEPVADADPDAGTGGEGETTDAAPAPEAPPAEAAAEAAAPAAKPGRKAK